VSSNDFNGPYRPARARGASNDSRGVRRPQNVRGGQGAQGGSRNGGGYARGGAYPPPEGWGADGIWRDSSVDANYETGALRSVGPRSRGQAGNGRHAGGPGQRGPFGDGATRVQQSWTGYRDAVTRFTGPFTGPITDSWRRLGDRMGSGGRGPGGPSGRGPGGRGPGGHRQGIGPGGRRIKRKGDWWRHWTLRKAVGVAGAAAGIFILAVVGVIFYEYSSTQIPTQELASDFVQNSTVYFSNGKTVVGSFGAEHRQILTYNQIPKVMQNAVLAAEERTYWTDGAISPAGIVRSAYDDLVHGDTAGGSTITQEFVRQYYQDIGTQQTASRKIKEIFVAEKLAKAESKQWILTNYLNTIYLGDDAYGVAAAAETYFNEPLSKITVGQAAVIAAIIQQPSTYPLPQYRSNLIARWHYVLDGLVKMGDLSAQQAATMKFPAMNTNPSAQFSGNEPWDGYIMSEVEDELTEVDHYSQSELDTGGLKVVLTVSQQDEQQLYKAVDYNISQIKAEGLTLPSYALIGAEEQNPANGDILAIYGGPGTNVSAKQCAGTCQLNTTLTGEQVGSSFKPYTVSAAVQEGMNVQTSVLNANVKLWVPPFSMGSTLSSTTPKPASEGYFPVHNDDDETIPGAQANGGTTVQNALAQSSNTAFTDLAHRVGLAPIQQMAESEGGVSPSVFPAHGEGVGITLGIDSLTVNDQATMVSTIDDNGVYHAAHMVASITQPGGAVTHPPVASHVALTPAEDSQVQYAMLKTTVDGTAPAAAMDDGRPIIGKTGTTTGSKSAFFVGAIPQYSLAVGIFCNKQSSTNPETLTGIGGFGGDWPAAIWHTFAENMWSNLSIENFLNPQFTGQAWIQVPPAPKAPPKKKQPTFGQQPGQPGNGHHHLFPTEPVVGPSTSPVTSSPSTSQSANPTASPSSSATTPLLPGSGAGNAGVTQVTSSVREGGVALGGALSVLPGSLLWVRISRRRRRRRHSGTAG